MENNPIVIEFLYHAPVAKVWKAITDQKEMKKWYFDLPEFKAETGCEFRFYGGKDKDNQYLHKCKVTEVIQGKKIAYSWRYEGYAGISYVAFELTPEKENTRLKLTHSGLETFPADNPDLARENFVEGWTYITGTSLKEFLDQSQPAG